MMRVCDFFIIIIYFFYFSFRIHILLSSRFTSSLTIASCVPSTSTNNNRQPASQLVSQSVSQLAAHSLVFHVLFEHHQKQQHNIIQSQIQHNNIRDQPSDEMNSNKVKEEETNRIDN